jgi:hypothetical protein
MPSLLSKKGGNGTNYSLTLFDSFEKRRWLLSLFHLNNPFGLGLRERTKTSLMKIDKEEPIK